MKYKIMNDLYNIIYNEYYMYLVCSIYVLYELEEEQTLHSLLPPVATSGNEHSAD